MQPSISRTYKFIRQESLKIFYKINQFWLIHSRSQHISDKAPLQGFTAWLEQTPQAYFNDMDSVPALQLFDAAYSCDDLPLLKKQSAIQSRHCALDGDDIDGFDERGKNRGIDQRLINKQGDMITFETPKAVIAGHDFVYKIWLFHVS